MVVSSSRGNGLRGSRAALGLALALAVGLGGCSGADDAEGGGGEGAPEAPAADAPLATVDGIAIPADVGLCAQNLVPTVGAGRLEFSWSAVPGATQYAVRATKAPPGATELTELFAGLQTATRYAFPEATSGVAYRIEVYALAEREPLCVLDGVNGVTPG